MMYSPISRSRSSSGTARCSCSVRSSWPDGHVDRRPLELVLVVELLLGGRAAEAVVEVLVPVDGPRPRLVLVGSSRVLVTAASRCSRPVSSSSLLVRVDLLEQGIALQFLAQDLLELEGGHLQQLEGLLQPLGHDQLLLQVQALVQADA